MSEEVTRGEIMRAIEQLSAENKAMREDITALKDAISTGKGAIHTLFWIGGVLGLLATLFNTFRH